MDMRNRRTSLQGLQLLESRLPLTATLSAVTSGVVAQQVVEDNGQLTGTQNVNMQVVTVASAGGDANNQAPVATGVAGFTGSSSQDYSISLFEAFTDPDGAVTDLVFSISGTPDPNVFDSVTIDQATGLVDVVLAEGADGDTTLSIVATDLNGATAGLDVEVETSSSDNVAITSIVATDNGDGSWTVEGQVTDSTTSDNTCDAAEVEFSGDFDGQSADVDDDGSFSTTVTITGAATGSFGAQAVDDDGDPVSGEEIYNY